MRYQFTGDLPTVVGSHSHGRNATVTRANPSPDVEESDGSTLVVHPGDVIETDEPIVSVWFEDLDAPDNDAPSLFAALSKPELVVAAQARDLPSSGSAKTLRERLDAFEAEHAPAQAPATNEAGNGGTDAGGILSPQTGADGSDLDPENPDEPASSTDDDENAAAATSDTEGDPS